MSQSGSEADEAIGVREAARIVGVHENTIRNWAQSGIIESTQIGGVKGYRRFSRLQVERLAQTLPEPPPADRTEAYQRGYADGWREATKAAQRVVAALPLSRETRSDELEGR